MRITAYLSGEHISSTPRPTRGVRRPRDKTMDKYYCRYLISFSSCLPPFLFRFFILHRGGGSSATAAGERAASTDSAARRTFTRNESKKRKRRRRRRPTNDDTKRSPTKRSWKNTNGRAHTHTDPRALMSEENKKIKM